MPMPAAIDPGNRKSNISNFSKPRSAATETTNRLVEVPMVVHIPPTYVPNPIGIRMKEGDRLERNVALIRIGMSNITTGVLLKGVFFGIKHAVKRMKEQKSGSIINMSSVAGLRTGFGGHLYSLSKAAIIQLTKTVVCIATSFQNQ